MKKAFMFNQMCHTPSVTDLSICLESWVLQVNTFFNGNKQLFHYVFKYLLFALNVDTGLFHSDQATTDQEFHFWCLHTFSGLTAKKVFDQINEEGSFPH